jgi:hypothetical protein
LEAAQTQHFAGGKAVGSRWVAGEPFAQQGDDFGWPRGCVITAGWLGRPEGLLGLGTGAQVVVIEFVEAGFAQLEMIARLD